MIEISVETFLELAHVVGDDVEGYINVRRDRLEARGQGLRASYLCIRQDARDPGTDFSYPQPVVSYIRRRFSHEQSLLRARKKDWLLLEPDRVVLSPATRSDIVLWQGQSSPCVETFYFDPLKDWKGSVGRINLKPLAVFVPKWKRITEELRSVWTYRGRNKLEGDADTSVVCLHLSWNSCDAEWWLTPGRMDCISLWFHPLCSIKMILEFPLRTIAAMPLSSMGPVTEIQPDPTLQTLIRVGEKYFWPTLSPYRYHQP
jgi:hypothetical protein